jgi:hypothetical protein
MKRQREIKIIPSKPKKVLFLTANPLHSMRRLEVELRQIRDTLRRSEHRDYFEMQIGLAVRSSDFSELILEQRPGIIHFSGHARRDKGLLLLDHFGLGSFVPFETVVQLLSIVSDHLECVIFNACQTEGLAKSVTRHVPYAVGMNGDISDSAAIEFSQGFYSALWAGCAIENAFKAGRLAIQQRFPSTGHHRIPIIKKKSNRNIEGKD